jgi:Mrp family chromosome partitioning ATPase
VAPGLSTINTQLSNGGLWLLPRGKTAHNSGELFLSEKCDRLLARMREDYDCVILDSIPVFAADDTTSLAPKVDGVLFVIRNKFTSADTARHALELLYERQAKVLGLVFNRANSASRSYKYYKYAKYYYSETTDH